MAAASSSGQFCCTESENMFGCFPFFFAEPQVVITDRLWAVEIAVPFLLEEYFIIIVFFFLIGCSDLNKLARLSVLGFFKCISECVVRCDINTRRITAQMLYKMSQINRHNADLRYHCYLIHYN